MANKHRHISVKNAKHHNLKNISVDIPHNKLTIVTGISGSGKSTLAFDTVYAEGQRRFVESLSAYARQFLERMEKPDVESISGLPPAIAIEQRPPSRNPRSTVGTTTEIYDYLRLMFGRIGTTICRQCGEPVHKDSPETITAEIMKWDEDDKLYILFPLSPKARNKNEELARVKELGYFRIMISGSDEIFNIEEQELPTNTAIDEIFVLVDRLKLKKDKENESRINESIETALHYGQERVIVRNLTHGNEQSFSSRYDCAECDILYEEPIPRLFSFNNPFGACPSCQGFGRTIGIDEDLVIPDQSRSIEKGALHPFHTQGHAQHLRNLIKHSEKHGINIDIPYRELPDDKKDLVWNGFPGYLGLRGFFKMLEEKNYKVHYRVMLSKYRGYTKCHACGGSRLRTSARQVYIGGKNIPALIKMPLKEILDYFNNLKLTSHQQEIAETVVNEIKWRLQLLVEIGLDYLTLDRLSHTLSGGESQRINLSTALGSSLVGTLYVLDEPSIGMHTRDTDRLLKILYKLRDMGNTIVVVEHDTDIINQADYIIDLGPHAGEYGGEVVYSGTIAGIKDAERSLTGDYLSGRKKIEIPKERKKGNGHKIIIHNPRENNLKMDRIEIPLGVMTVVTGVSGSGKSTLVNDILYAGVKRLNGGFQGHIGAFDKIEGYNYIDSLELVDQSPIGKSSRSTPATYTKAFDAIREVFSITQAAKQLGVKPGYFSFNVPGGRCDTCEGEGIVTVDMQFLPDVHLQCEDCKGTRYKKEARNILFKGKSIVDVLNMTIAEAVEHFEGISKITKKLSVLYDVGLGYLRLGQPSTMLSGGESQRVKLANHLDSSRNQTLFIFDEPTTGLHLDDISKLMDCFNRLVRQGHSVVIIEHNMHVIASADWIIDLGPEAGDKGGQLVGAGTPEEIVKLKNSYTGAALKELLK